MARSAEMPVRERPHSGKGAEVHRLRRRPQAQYYAFLSYSHRDEELADWLHRELEEFHVPPALAGKLTRNGVVPKRLAPIFRDEHELAAADDLGEEIEHALASSQFLIVLCSPAAAKSRWTNAEIELFKKSRPEGCILAAIASGEPFASEIPGREHEECFPPALRRKYDRRGHPTNKRAEPLAADLREEGQSRWIGFMKLVAGMLGVGLDDLIQRETTRRHKRMAWITAVSVVGMLFASALAFTAIRSRDEAREQRRQAEGLVSFMLGDLKDKLEPIGKLDALDGVGSKVLSYYKNQDASKLSDAALLQRSRALNLMAEVAHERGHLDEASGLYHQAAAGTAEAIRRNPDDPQRLYDHAQNIFWIADIERNRGNVKSAEAGMREYKRLADRMVTIAPDNMKWRMEQQSADTNLGISLIEQRRFEEATGQFKRALQNMRALSGADPQNSSYQKATTEVELWLADAREAAGNLNEATALREQLIAELNRLFQQTGDVEYRQKLVPAERLLGDVYLARGDVGGSLAHYTAAVSQADFLVASEPTNSRWKSYAARSRLSLAEGLIAAHREEDAIGEAARACDITVRLIAMDGSVQGWRALLRDCWETRSHIALSRGEAASSVQYAQKAILTAQGIRSTNTGDDRYAVADAWLLLGNARAKLGDSKGAIAAWQSGLAVLPISGAEKPSEMAQRAALLQRLDRTPEAQDRLNRLKTIGYRPPKT